MDIVLSEVRRFLSDRGSVLVLVVAFPLYAFFYPLPYLEQVPKRMPILVVDQDHSEPSRLLIRKADQNELLRVVGEALSMSEAERRTRDGEVAGTLLIPKGFERKVKRGGQGVVGAYVDAAYFLPYRQVLTGLTTTAAVVSAGVEVKRWGSAGLPRAQALRRQAAARVETHNLFNPEGGYGAYVVPAVLVLIFQQVFLIGIGILMGTARERGTGDVGWVGSSAGVAFARATAYVALGLIHCVLCRFVVYPVFDLPFRAPLGVVALFLVPYLYACAFMAFAIGRLWRERESAMLFLVFTSLPGLFLCGFAWPPEAMPKVLTILAKLLPSTSGIPGYLRLAHMGASLGDVLPEALCLAVLVVFYYLLATRDWKK